MGLFTEAVGQAAVIVQGGVYKQVKVFVRDGHLYAQDGTGFVRINANGSTTKPTCMVETLDWEGGALGVTSLGRLCLLREVTGAKPLPGNKAIGFLAVAKD